ncbi:MAG: hydroxymethylbilane synthase [Planctomycetota bacterium]
MSTLVIGTRGSELARWQAESVRKALLREHPELSVELRIVSTKGDRDRSTALSQVEGVGFFTREVEIALLEEQADVAVHSLKDLPTRTPEPLTVAAVPGRADPADALVAPGGDTLAELPRGARVLTGSMRRKAQLLHHRADLDVRPVRGNVETRVRKVREGPADALVLARAGLVRLGLEKHIAQRFDSADEFVPACGQGALAVQVRAGDERAVRLCAAIDDSEAHAATAAERTFLATLGGGCRLPLAAWGRFEEDEELTLTGLVTDLRGRRVLKRTLRGPARERHEAEELGQRMAEELRREGADEVLAEALRETETEAGR